MKLKKLALLLAVSTLAACSDKSGDESNADNGSLLDKASQMNSELVESVKEKSRAVAESVDKSIDSAQEKVSETVAAVKETSAEMVASATETPKSLVDSASQSLTSAETPVDPAVTQAAQADAAAVVEQGEVIVTESTTIVEDTATGTTAAVSEVETAVMETSGVVAAEADPAQMAVGKRVYSGSCMSCHGAGIAGAPKVGDAALWQTRIEKGMDTLNLHAVNGYKGSSGYMPPKGGFSSLNDDEVKAAVAYMVSASQ